MADNIIKVNVTSVKQQRVSVSSSQVGTEITASGDTGRFWAQTAKNWAVSDVIVDNTDYSSKHYAQEAKESAQNASNFENATRESYNSFLETSANAVTEIQGVKEETLTEIDNSKTNAVDSINTVKNNAVDSINSTKTTILNDIEFVADGEKKEIIDLADEIKVSGDTVNTAIEAGVERLNSIDALKKSQITNCITEIPQRIKYTLEDGKLTIHAGSVVIVPYGTEDKTSEFPVGSRFLHDNFKVYDTQFADGKFFVWAEVVNDIVKKETWSGNGRGLIFLNLEIGIDIYIEFVNQTSSGSDFSSTTPYNTRYNTTENLIKRSSNTGGTWLGLRALPLLQINYNNGYKSIDQIFNGFGKIGSTVWSDKGIKYLSPNGRNADGTLRNAELVTKKLMTDTLQTESRTYFINEANWSRRVTATCFEQSIMPTLPLSTGAVWFNTDENQMYAANSGETAWHKIHGYANIGTAGLSDFNFKQPFRAVDYNDKSEVSGWSMPSGKYIDLTLGASGTTYTAPANGFVRVSTATANVTVSINVQDKIGSTSTSSNNIAVRTFCPVKKGDIFTINYSSSSGIKLQFFYAEGEV